MITVLHASGVSQNLGLKEFVQNDMLHIPDNVLEHLPPGTLSIIHLCSWTPLPSVSTNSPTFTFEMESSNISWAEILKRPIPPKCVTSSLYHHLHGIEDTEYRSVVLSSESLALRFPLDVVLYWYQSSVVIGAQTTWRRVQSFITAVPLSEDPTNVADSSLFLGIQLSPLV